VNHEVLVAAATPLGCLFSFKIQVNCEGELNFKKNIPIKNVNLIFLNKKISSSRKLIEF
jgi:hypothetical protein